MVGGDERRSKHCEPIFTTLAPEDGYAHVGPSGAGHFVKMVHNGIEYGMLQAYAEGYEILHASKHFSSISHQIAELWQHGSVVRSWMNELAERAFAGGQDLNDVKGWVADSGEGRWTVQEAIDLDVPAPVITLAAPDPVPLPPGRIVRRQGDRGAPQGIRRPRGEEGMTGAISVPVKVDLPSGSGGKRKIGPSTVVILGGAGDLTRRKLIPALFHLLTDGLIRSDLEVLAVGRADWSDADFQNEHAEGGGRVGRPGGDQLHRWDELAPKLIGSEATSRTQSTFKTLGQRLEARDQALGAPAGRLFYLAIPPSVYATTIASLAESGIAPRRNNPSEQGWVRVVVEKPFGRSLATAHELNQQVRAAFAEHQVYRIDHYLGKETVQNLLVLRFANSIFEPIWNRNHIHHVQITAAESLGVGHRAGYYEEAGVVRDMFQNHLLQLLALTAMEPPAAFRADAVRDEKIKVLTAVRPFEAASLAEVAVRGQYGPGVIDGSRVPGYREEENVAAESPTATYAAIRFQVDNWRWQGVPFFLRSGKRMPRRVTEIAIQFREPPHLLFPNQRNGAMTPNVLTIEIQPEEGLSLCFDIKVPGIGVRTTAARMDFNYDRLFGGNDHSAYETLLLDCLAGDQTLFIRDDTTEAAWRIVDPIIDAWGKEAPDGLPNYAAGEWGPKAADELIQRAGAAWRRP